jgi:glycosidase
LPLHGDWRTRNVAAEERDPNSMLSLTRALLRLRRQEPALSVGDYRRVPCEGTLLAYERRAAGSRLIVALNLGAEPVAFPDSLSGGERLHSTLPGEADVLRGNEGVIVRTRR